MATKLPDFQTLPPEDELASVSGNQNPDNYQKPATRPSYVNSMTNNNSSEGLDFDPKMRRQWSVEPTLVHATRPLDPNTLTISDELRSRHEQSAKDYPDLNLSDNEYIIAEVYRHPIGLFMPIAGATVFVILLLSVLFTYPLLQEVNSAATLPTFGLLALIVVPLILIICIFAYISVWVYLRNKFYLTNESVIQEIQMSLFSRREQTASLGSIEDVSYFQTGIIQTMLDYGSIRLSTEGDETTYRYYYVAKPRDQVAALTNAVEDFKNGRPVSIKD